jgi:hypothetical protein
MRYATGNPAQPCSTTLRYWSPPGRVQAPPSWQIECKQQGNAGVQLARGKRKLETEHKYR